MTYEEFLSYIQEHIRGFLPEEYQELTPHLRTVMKNNGVSYDGLTFSSDGLTASPVIYLNSFYKEYTEGTDIDEVLKKISSICEKNRPAVTFDFSLLTDYERAKEQISCRLVGRERNEELLLDGPFTPVEDLAVIYYLDTGSIGEYSGHIHINREIFDRYGVPVETMHRQALANMKTQSPVVIRGIFEMLFGQPPSEKEILFVVTNESGTYGAAGIMDPEVLTRLTEYVGNNYYILPSSVHEVLVASKANGITEKELRQMVQKVNRSAVKPEEWLSDSVYEYDAKTQRLSRCEDSRDMEIRKQQDGHEKSIGR